MIGTDPIVYNFDENKADLTVTVPLQMEIKPIHKIKKTTFNLTLRLQKIIPYEITRYFKRTFGCS